MKIFIDECVDRRLASYIDGHEAKTARDMGWIGIQNGALLALAAAQFDVFLTVDRNLAFQQNVMKLPLRVLVLCAPSNRLADLVLLMPDLIAALDTIGPHELKTVGRD